MFPRLANVLLEDEDGNDQMQANAAVRTPVPRAEQDEDIFEDMEDEENDTERSQFYILKHSV